MRGDCRPDEPVVYTRGDIVRNGDVWGVVRRVGMGVHACTVTWWTGQYASGSVEKWITDGLYPTRECSAPFNVNYVGIPEQVLAKSMEIILLGEDNK